MFSETGALWLPDWEVISWWPLLVLHYPDERWISSARPGLDNSSRDTLADHQRRRLVFECHTRVLRAPFVNLAITDSNEQLTPLADPDAVLLQRIRYFSSRIRRPKRCVIVTSFALCIALSSRPNYRVYLKCWFGSKHHLCITSPALVRRQNQ